MPSGTNNIMPLGFAFLEKKLDEQLLPFIFCVFQRVFYA